MADERYEWLDKDSAERLLRGEYVEPADATARGEAERLSLALRGIADVTSANEFELPGEAKALAAFRAAAGGTEAGGGGRAVDGGEESALPAVRISSVRRTGGEAGFRRVRRRAVLGVVAGCALSATAVAVGLGTLPGAFDRGRPLPAGSVSTTAPSVPPSGAPLGGRVPVRPTEPAQRGPGGPAPRGAADPQKGGGETGGERPAPRETPGRPGEEFRGGNVLSEKVASCRDGVPDHAPPAWKPGGHGLFCPRMPVREGSANGGKDVRDGDHDTGWHGGETGDDHGTGAGSGDGPPDIPLGLPAASPDDAADPLPDGPIPRGPAESVPPAHPHQSADPGLPLDDEPGTDPAPTPVSS